MAAHEDAVAGEKFLCHFLLLLAAAGHAAVAPGALPNDDGAAERLRPHERGLHRRPLLGLRGLACHRRRLAPRERTDEGPAHARSVLRCGEGPNAERRGADHAARLPLGVRRRAHLHGIAHLVGRAMLRQRRRRLADRLGGLSGMLLARARREHRPVFFFILFPLWQDKAPDQAWLRLRRKGVDVGGIRIEHIVAVACEGQAREHDHAHDAEEEDQHVFEVDAVVRQCFLDRGEIGSGALRNDRLGNAHHLGTVIHIDECDCFGDLFGEVALVVGHRQNTFFHVGSLDGHCLPHPLCGGWRHANDVVDPHRPSDQPSGRGC
mmetsp:Transcript_29995/g.86305  ORF Transcript_29995/g.86305 Transcript_29995/m.86305 type:complete len:321 (-) Transcript_29995:845-1807(-)